MTDYGSRPRLRMTSDLWNCLYSYNEVKVKEPGAYLFVCLLYVFCCLFVVCLLYLFVVCFLLFVCLFVVFVCCIFFVVCLFVCLLYVLCCLFVVVLFVCLFVLRKNFVINYNVVRPALPRNLILIERWMIFFYFEFIAF